MHLPSGTLLQGSKYKIIEKIGQGGFGIAYRAYHNGLQCNVCIKEFYFRDLCERVPNSTHITIISTSPEKIKLVDSLRKKFAKEAHRLAQFQNPHIIHVMDNFEENNTAYFVMEYLEGGSLEDVLERGGSMSEEKAKIMILPIIDALEAVHNKGLLHLDIKPANIMLRKNQSMVLIDFGISKYMEIADGYTTTAPIGISKGYAPLEQYGGTIADFTKATDIYSLCATLYKMVTGQTPPEPLQILVNGIKPPREFQSQLSKEFNDVIIKGLLTKAIDRPQTMTKLKGELSKQKQSNETVETTVPIDSVSLDSDLIYFKHRYEELFPFKDGLAKVKISGKYGYIDRSGKEVIDCDYDSIGGFFAFVTCFKKNTTNGIINKRGQIISNTMHTYGFLGIEFSEGLAKVYEMRSGLCYTGFINEEGRVIIPCKYGHYGYASEFSEGYAVVEHFFIDKNDRKLSINYGNIQGLSQFEEGLAGVWKKDSWLFGKWVHGFINKEGKLAIPFLYESAYSFSEGLVAVKKNGYWGFLNKDGKEIIPIIYDKIEAQYTGKDIVYGFHDGFAKVKLNNTDVYINKDGRNIMSSNYKRIDGIGEGLAKVINNDDLYGFIDNTGKEVIICQYDSASVFENGISIILKNGKWRTIDKKGNTIISFKNRYDVIESHAEGMYVVKINDKYGYSDINGIEVIKCQFNKAVKFSEGLALVELNDDKFYITKMGKRVSYIHPNVTIQENGIGFRKLHGNPIEIKYY